MQVLRFIYRQAYERTSRLWPEKTSATGIAWNPVVRPSGPAQMRLLARL